jgi:hypothetical protein
LWALLAETGLRLLGAVHARFYRFGEKPRIPPRVDEAKIIDDASMSRIMANVQLLGEPVKDGGLGDEQAMRILLVVATTGRRLSEILLLDRDPLLPLHGIARTAGEEGFVAKLRYRQTKIEDGPNTILIDADTVAVIRAQREWADREMTTRGLPGVVPRYLFIALRMNRDGHRPYPEATLHSRLRKFVELADLRDDHGRPLRLSRTHSFRHTRATSLINAGVPLPVVQRYFGHLSPTMTMHYVQISDQTQQREFLRFKKITADGRELEIDPTDLYQLLELDKRADRILPNSWCLLPPRQVCERGNACLTCDKFATDRSYLPDHDQQLDLLGKLIDTRKQAFEARTGREMPEENIWLAERRKEQQALGKIIAASPTRRPRPTRSAARAPAGTAEPWPWEPREPTRRRAAQEPRHDQARRDRSAQDDQGRRTDHLPRRRPHRQLLDRLPLRQPRAAPADRAPPLPATSQAHAGGDQRVERRQQRHSRAHSAARRTAPPPPRRDQRPPRSDRRGTRREPRTATAPRSARNS